MEAARRKKKKGIKKEISVDDEAKDTRKQTARNQRDEHEPDGEKTGQDHNLSLVFLCWGSPSQYC